MTHPTIKTIAIGAAAATVLYLSIETVHPAAADATVHFPPGEAPLMPTANGTVSVAGAGYHSMITDTFYRASPDTTPLKGDGQHVPASPNTKRGS
jgi:hypothetical protein